MRTSSLASVRDTGMLRLYAWVMIITAGLAVAVALHVTQTEPQYSASAEVVLAPTITRSGNYIQPSMPTEQRVANSTEVLSDAARRVGVPTEQVAERISVTVPVDTQILVLTYTADTPTEALSGAKALADVVPAGSQSGERQERRRQTGQPTRAAVHARGDELPSGPERSGPRRTPGRIRRGPGVGPG